MALSRRVFGLLALLLGLLGLVGCIAAIVGIWSGSARLNHTADRVFATIDSTLAAVQERVGRAEERVQEARITSQDIEQSLKRWTEREVRERLASRFEVEEKCERLASRFEQADQWLESSESSVQLARQAIEWAASIGAPVGTEPLDRLLDGLASMRLQLTEAAETAERIRQRIAETGEEGPFEADIDDIVRLALRVVATLSSVDSRLRDFQKRLSETRTLGESLRTKTRRWMRIVTIGITLLISWMAAGQCALCILGWRGLRQGQTRHEVAEKRPSPHSNEVAGG